MTSFRAKNIIKYGDVNLIFKAKGQVYFRIDSLLQMREVNLQFSQIYPGIFNKATDA